MMTEYDNTAPRSLRSSQTAVLAAQGVSAGYGGLDRLEEATVTLEPGIHVLLGPNGAGKTTLFRVLSGVLPPRAGRVTFNGDDLHRDPRVRSQLALAGHRPALAPRLTVDENLRYWARVLGLPRAGYEQKIAVVLAELELDAIAQQPASRLSRGQTQRVSLARALLADPMVLLLDEPLAGLDPGASARMLARLRDLGASGRIVLISAHELAEVAEIADCVAVLAGGRLHGHGPPARLYEEFVGNTGRLRLRGGPGLAAAVEAHGYPVLARGGTTVEITFPGSQAIQQLIASLVHAGIGITEASPLGNPLSGIYRGLEEGGAHL